MILIMLILTMINNVIFVLMITMLVKTNILTYILFYYESIIPYNDTSIIIFQLIIYTNLNKFYKAVSFYQFYFSINIAINRENRQF